MNKQPMHPWPSINISSRKQTVLIAVLAVACCFAGCGKKEDPLAGDTLLEQPSPAAESASAPAPQPEPAELESTEPVVPFGGNELRAGAQNISYKPLPEASKILEFDDTAAELATDQRSQLAKAADRFMVATIPDFAVKDTHRPWLDRQYLPVVMRIKSGPDDGLQAELSMRVLQWDEREVTKPDRVAVLLEWTGGQWHLVAAPAQFRTDLANAVETLKGDWQPGERHLPRSE